MQINVTFRHMEHDAGLKDYVDDRFAKLKKYSDAPMNINVVLSKEKYRNCAEVVVSGDGIRAAAKQEHEDLRSAIDLVLDKIERQLKKFREKLKGKNKKRGTIQPQSAAASGIAEEELSQESEEVILVDKIPPKPMSIEEAADQLQVTGMEFLAFRNAETNQINVIYWRNDGLLGLLEP